MKRKAVRVILVLAVLGALAAIPASTQVSTSTSQATAARAGDRLPLLLVVNRLELSRAQMQTLRETIGGLLDRKTVLDEKRAVFEQEMIAFSGTAEDLDVRVAAFESEMAATRALLAKETVAALDTLKETLSMKQGEILRDAFPDAFGRLDVWSGGASGSTSQTPPGAVTGRSPEIEGRGKMVALKARQATGFATAAENGVARVRGQEESAASSRGAAASPAQTLVERIRQRIAGRLGASASASESDSAAACPMMSVTPQSSSSVSADAAAELETNSGSFGTVTISLSSGDWSMDAGAGRLMAWLEAFVEVLELKLAAMP